MALPGCNNPKRLQTLSHVPCGTPGEGEGHFHPGCSQVKGCCHLGGKAPGSRGAQAEASEMLRLWISRRGCCWPCPRLEWGVPPHPVSFLPPVHRAHCYPPPKAPLSSSHAPAHTGPSVGPMVWDGRAQAELLSGAPGTMFKEKNTDSCVQPQPIWCRDRKSLLVFFF